MSVTAIGSSALKTMTLPPFPRFGFQPAVKPPTAFHLSLEDNPEIPGKLSVIELKDAKPHQALYYQPTPDQRPRLIADITPGIHDQLRALEIKDGSVVIDQVMPAAHRAAWVFSGGQVNDRTDGTVVKMLPQDSFEAIYRDAAVRLEHAPLTRPAIRDSQALINLQVVQPVGGSGSRLFPLTDLVPKPAVPINRDGLTLIGSTLHQLQDAGAAQIHVTTRVKPEQIDQALKGLHPVQQVYEGNKALGDFGAVARALVKLHDGQPLDPASDPHLSLDKPLLLVFGDAYIQGVDFGAMLARHQQHNAGISILTMEVPPAQASQFGILSVEALDSHHDGLQKITAFTEKPDHPASNIASTGIAILSPEVLQAIPDILREKGITPDQSINLGKVLLPALIEQLNHHDIKDAHGQPQMTLAQPLKGVWLDVGNHGTYFAVRRHEDQLRDHDPVYWHGLTPANEIKATGNVLMRMA